MLLLSSVSAEASGPRGHKRLLGDGRSIYAEFFSPRPSRLARNEPDYALPGSDPRIRRRRNVELDEFATLFTHVQPGRVALGVSDSAAESCGSCATSGSRMRPQFGTLGALRADEFHCQVLPIGKPAATRCARSFDGLMPILHPHRETSVPVARMRSARSFSSSNTCSSERPRR